MSYLVLKAENISKQYRLGQIGTGTVSHDLNRLFARATKREDPYAKVGENTRGNNFIWALKDINFEVTRGEVLGIIGKNGAGKSTLLKILSQVASPTTGEVKIKGRIAALLEVGTGFHPDLTGRENIFLNGAILGMTRVEIKKKLDEIISFSGVEKYLDTPVKRYSSGMIVRLGFSVAAHLEPEILIVDEVLAVGDAEFQQKCLGKMKDVSGQGRTVLFVSHNMAAVKNLCTRAMLIESGSIKSSGPTGDIIGTYLNENRLVQSDGLIPNDFYRPYSNGEAFFRSIVVSDMQARPVTKLALYENFSVSVELEVLKPITGAVINLNIATGLGEPVLYTYEKNNSAYQVRNFEPGIYKVKVEFDTKLLPGNYCFNLAISYFSNGTTIDYVENIYFIAVEKIGLNEGEVYPWNLSHGFAEPDTKWNITKI